MRRAKVRLSERGVYEIELSEDEIVGQIRQLLELNGARTFRVKERIPTCVRAGCRHYLSEHQRLGSCKKCGCRKYVGATSELGIPDLFGWWPGAAQPPVQFFIEVKRPGGARRPGQMVWIERARADGIIAFFAESCEEMVQEFATFGVMVKGLR